MAASPSPKRRRQGDSPFDMIDDSVIDPSLMPSEEVPQPSNVEEQPQPENDPAKDDPTYQLCVERAYADQRFKATMNHIFEKYGRDFDGIGDEIDLETGEIVVNNGHVQNMRNEADIGDGAAEPPEGEEEECQGTYLGDNTDGSDDEEHTAADDSADTQPVESQAHASASNTANQQPFNLGMNMYDPRFTAMLPALYAGAQAAFGWGMPGGMPVGMMPGMPGMPGMPQDMPSGPPPMMQQGMDAQQPMFMPPPMAWGAWGMPADYSIPPWMQQFQQPQQAPPNLPAFNKPVQRYDFPAQSGRTSVWAKNSRYKDDNGARQARIGSRPSVLSSKARTNRPRPAESLLNPTVAAANGDPDDEDADDEELLALDEQRRFRALPPRSGEEEDSELFWEDESATAPEIKNPPKKRGRGRPKGSKSKHNLVKLQDGELPSTKSKVEMKRREREALKEKLLAQHYEQNPGTEPETEDTEGRRRSGRDRKTADESKEMMSWDRVKAVRRAEYKAMMTIRSDRKIAKRERASSREPRDGTDPTEVSTNDVIPNSEEEREEQVAAMQEPASTIPDSQESTALQSITGSQKLNKSHQSPEKKPAKQRRAQQSTQQAEQQAEQQAFDALLALSDDEAPAIVARRKVKRPQELKMADSAPSEPPNKTVAEAATNEHEDNEKPGSRLEKPSHSTWPGSIDASFDASRRDIEDYSNLLDVFPSSSPIFERRAMPLSPGGVSMNSSPPMTANKSGYGLDETSQQEIWMPSPSKNNNHDEPSLFVSNDDDAAKGEQPAYNTQYKPTATTTATVPGSQTSPKGKTAARSSRKPPAKTSSSSRRHSPDKPQADPNEAHDTIDSEATLVEEAVNAPSAQELVIRSPKPPSVSLTATDYEVPKVSLKRAASSSTPSRPSSSSKRKVSRTSSKRHSLLSLVGDDDVDELDRTQTTLPKSSTSKTKQPHKIRKPSLVSKDGHRPSSAPKDKNKSTDASLAKKTKRNKPASPAPVAAARTCGVDGFACGQDFCFTCL